MKRVLKNSTFMQSTVIIKYEDSEILTNDSLSIIKGSVGSGKSRLCLNLIKGLCGKSDDLGFTYSECPRDKGIYYISTEMSDYHLHKRYLEVLNQVGDEWENQLHFYNFYPEDNLNDLKPILKENPPHVIIIDQCADLITGINDEKEANTLIKKLSTIARSLTTGLIVVIHQNENSTNNSKARGHLGSGLEQKSISSIAVNKNERTSVFTIQSTKVREGIPFKIKAEFNTDSQMLKSSEYRQNLFELLKFPSKAGELKIQIKGIMNCSDSQADNYLKTFKEKNLVTTVKEGRNQIYHKK